MYRVQYERLDGVKYPKRVKDIHAKDKLHAKLLVIADMKDKGVDVKVIEVSSI